MWPRIYYSGHEYVLNLGCGGRTTDKKAWFGQVRVDIEAFPNVTHVMDIHDLKFNDEEFDRVVCYTTLEHLDSPIKAMKEMRRVLKTGGQMEIVIPNVLHYRRIWLNYKQLIKKINESDPEKLPNHKQAWDIIEMRNLMKQVGLLMVSVSYLDWLPRFKPRGGIKLYLLNKLLPECFTRTEVKYVLCREIEKKN